MKTVSADSTPTTPHDIHYCSNGLAQATALQQEYADILCDSVPPGLPPRRAINHNIEILPGSEAPHKKPYRLSEAEYQELRSQLSKLLEMGHIRPSHSPYGAPVLFVKKKTGDYRMVVDYRALNKIIVKDRYRLPSVHELLDRLVGAKVHFL